MNNDKYVNDEGRYEGIVEMPSGGWLQLSGENQTPYIAIPLKVTGDDVDAGKIITWCGWLSDKALERTIDTLVKCFDFDGDLNSLYAGKQTFKGKLVSFTTKIEEYNGKQRCKVAWLNPHGYSHQVPKLDESTALTLLSGISKRAKEIAKASRSGEPNVPAGNPPSVEDDVPF
jgi:hypothetical protein